MRELLKQFKKIVGQKDLTLERAKTAAANGSNLSGLGDTSNAGDGNNFNGTANGVSFGEAKDAVGESVEGEGFGLGFAQDTARPGQIDAVGSPLRSVGGGSPSRRTNNMGDTLDDEFSAAQSKTNSRGGKERFSKGEVPDDKEEVSQRAKRAASEASQLVYVYVYVYVYVACTDEHKSHY